MKYEKLIHARKLKGFTQKQLAEKIAMEQTTLSRKERGLSPITEEEWSRIAKILDVHVDVIRENLPQNGILNIENEKIPVPKNILVKLLENKTEHIKILKELLKK